MLEKSTRTRVSKCRSMQCPDLFVVVVALRSKLQRLKEGRLPKDLRFSIVDINSFVSGNGLV